MTSGGFEPVVALARGITVLRAFRDHSDLTVADVAARTAIDRSAVRRLLDTLADRGLVESDGQRFRLHPSVLGIGRAYLDGLRLPAVAAPHLRDLVERVDETAVLGVLDGVDLVVVASGPAPRRIMAATATVGDRSPAADSAAGRVLLARRDAAWLDGFLAGVADRDLRRELGQVARDGHCLRDPVAGGGHRSLAVPVSTPPDVPDCALVVIGHAARWDRTTMTAELLPVLRATAGGIGDDAAALSA